VTLFFPRLVALRRDRREVGWRRLTVLGALGTLFWAGAYAVTVRVLRHFATVDPDLGRILAAKLLALLFLLLLTFLAFSALISAISQCFLARDLPLWVAAPVPLRRLFRFKLVEISVFASWTAIFLALPVFVAYGTVFEGGAEYYAALVLVLAPCIAIAASLGILFAIALVNLLPARRARDLLSLIAIVFMVGVVMLLRVMRPERFVRPEDFGTWAEYLVSMSNPTLPWLPSYWGARALGEVLGIYQATQWPAVWYYGGLLAFGALLTMGVAALVFRQGFESGWSRAQEARQVRWTRARWWKTMVGHVGRPFPRRVRAIMIKDAATFFRDPSQWSQLVLLLAVIAVYLYNFHVLPLDAAGGTGYFMRNLLAFLNVGLVGLVVTALAARFVLPGVSLEGGTLWLLRTSPMAVRELLWAKFWGGFLPLLAVAELLVVVSNTLLHTTPMLGILSVAAVFCLSGAIAGLAVGLGAAHPRFDAADGTQVAAGYAGFLFMVLSALLVLFSVTVLAWPVYHSFRAAWLGWGTGAREWGGMAGGLLAVAGISTIALYGSMRSGCERMELGEE
jgi:ABC-2 type transport system permease protein